MMRPLFRKGVQVFDKRIFALVPQAKAMIIAAAVCMFASLAGWVAAAYAACCVVAAAVSGSAFPGWALCACVVGAAACFAGDALAERAKSKVASEVRRTLRRDVFGKLVRLGSSFQEHMSLEEANQVLGGGMENISRYCSAYVPQFFYGTAGLLGMFAFACVLYVPAAIALLAAAILIPVTIVIFMRRSKAGQREYWDSYVDMGALFRDSIRGLGTLKAYLADERRHERLNRVAAGFRKKTMGVLAVQLNAVTIMDLFTYGGAGVGCVMAANACAAGQLGLANALALCVLSVEFFMPLRRLGTLFHTGMNAGPVIDRVCEVLDAPEPQPKDVDLDLNNADIVCEGLSYSYDGEREVLSSVDFQAEPGSFVGVTGESGSGKSTLAKVLCGQLSNYTGSVRIAGVEVRDLPPAQLHAAVTLVSSAGHVFKGTFRSNLALGNPDATDAQMWNALHRCRLDTFAVEMGGLDAEVAEGGANLSGGQRQRLRAARALLHDTPIYVFDEATSNVDASSEKALLNFIQELSMERTVVFVSHRLAALAWTDRIYVFDDGAVVQRGRHAYLAAEPGEYHDLWLQQRELEDFADAAYAQVEAERRQQDISSDEVQHLIANMPDKVASLVRGAYDAREVAALITGEKKTAPLGHPSWIPIPEGATEKPASAASADDAAAGEAAVSNGASPEGADGSGESGGDVKDPAENASADEANPADMANAPAERGSFAVVRGIMRLSRSLNGGFALAVLLGALGAAAPVFVGASAASASVGAGLAGGMLALVLLCAILRGPVGYAERLSTHSQTFRILDLLRDKVFGALRKLAPAILEERDTGDLLSLVTTDVELLELWYARTMPVMLSAAIVAVCMCAWLGAQQLSWGLCALAAYALIGIAVPLLAAGAAKRVNRQGRSTAVLMGSFLMESLEGLSDLLQYGAGDERLDEMDDGSDQSAPSEQERVLARSSSLGKAAARAIALLAVVAMAALVSSSAVSGVVAPGAALGALAGFALSLPAVLALANLSTSFGMTVAAGDRLLDLLEAQPETPDVKDGEDVRSFTGLSVDDVTFSYGEGDILSHVSLDVQPGHVLRVAGPSGTGKSTLVKLIMRFWDVDGGSISLSGTDIRRINTESLRSLEGYLPQDTYLFAGTLRENITLDAPDVPEQRLQQAIDDAALDSLIERLPQGLETRIGEGQADLSDGERQRVGLARLFLYAAPFWILDEPTSNLDSLNEAAVLMALSQYREKVTMVIVSHRASCALISDETYVTKRRRAELTMGETF